MVAQGRNRNVQQLSVSFYPFDEDTKVAVYQFTRSGKPQDWAVYQVGNDGSVDARRFFYDNGKKHGDTTMYVNAGVQYQAWMIVLSGGAVTDLTPVLNTLSFIG